MAEHWCKEHKVIWFKKGAMKGFAHPILDENGEPTGEWCNESQKKKEIIQDEVTPTVKANIPMLMTKDDWAEKDKITRKSIERQTALNAAVEVAKLLLVGDITTAKIVATAKAFETYLETGVAPKEAKPPAQGLVEEAKKLGAVEVG